jgi:hypothetical protein
VNKIILSIQILSLVTLVFLFREFFLLRGRIASLESRPTPSQIEPSAEAGLLPSPPVSASEEELKAYIDSVIASLPTTAPAPATTTAPAVSSSSPQTSFVPMGSSTTTTSTDWIDVPGSEVYIDLANDYKTDAYITFSASLKVAHGNGQAYARLYDATNKIAVIGSELTTINNATATQVTSGKLNFWSGNNLYKVQIKSLNSFEVTYASGKIKIVY